MVCGAESSAGDVGKAASYNDVTGQVDVSQTLSLPCMDAITAFDYRLFLFVNEGWVSPFLDFLMPFLSGNDFFRPILALVAGGLLWKGGRRGRCFVLILVLTLALGEYGTGRLKKAIERPRPFITHLETRMLAGKGLNASMPSGHAAIWAAAAVVSFGYYRRSLRVMGPLALGVGISRVYVGVHYPSDVLAGWLWGALYGWGLPRLLNGFWGWLGRGWLPLWWRRFPSLLPNSCEAEGIREMPSEPGKRSAELESHWRRLTFFTLGMLTVIRWVYLAGGVIELSEDEAYQWLWSKHLALSYYSKPPLIAYAQWIGTSLFGNTELGVRFLSPLLSTVTAFVLSWFVASLAGWRLGFLMAAAANVVPLLVVGSILITIDPLTVTFWTVAMVSGWRAIREDSTLWWGAVGLASAGAFLSKYFSPFLILSFAVFFVVWPSARGQLRRKGPWLALGMSLVAVIPVFVWNAQNGWITLTHLKERGGLGEQWTFRPLLIAEFLGAEIGLWNPVFFLAIVWAIIGFLMRRRLPLIGDESRRMAQVYCLSMGLPVFLIYFAYTLHSRVQPNWVATSILPLGAFALLWWDERHRAGAKAGRRLLIWGFVIGLPIALVLFDTNLVGKLTGRYLPPGLDLHRRVRGYREAAAVVEAHRVRLETEGRPVLIVTDHYGWTGILNFYLPGAASRVTTDPMVTVRETERPINQVWFWPEYRYSHRKGLTVLYLTSREPSEKEIARMSRDFESAEAIAGKDIFYRGRLFHQLHMHILRNQR